MTRLIQFLVLLSLALAGPALAESYPPLQGFAAAQAPEAGTGICFGEDAAESLRCAQDKCIAQSGLTAEDCVPQAWCFPSGWAADVLMQSREGPHWHEYLCGWQDEAQLQRAIKAKCQSDGLMECTAVQIWDQDGVEQLAE